MNFLFIFVYLEVNRVDAIIMNVILMDINTLKIIENNIEYIVRKIPNNMMEYENTKSENLCFLIFGKKEYIWKNNPDIKINKDIIIAELVIPIEWRKNQKNRTFTTPKTNHNSESIFQYFILYIKGIIEIVEKIIKNVFVKGILPMKRLRLT